jgi:hypothetical protein
MSRHVIVGAAQMGPIACDEGRLLVIDRMLALMREASAAGCDVVVYPELALTTFFPRWFIEDHEEVEAVFRTQGAHLPLPSSPATGLGDISWRRPISA